MSVRIYEGPTMDEALGRACGDLGRNAVILDARPVRRRRWLGLLGRREVFRVAAAPQAGGQAPAAEPIRGYRPEAGQYIPARSGGLDVPPALRDLADKLRRAELDEAVVTELAGRLQADLNGREMEDASRLRRRCRDVLAEMIPTDGALSGASRPGRPRVIVLLGPTGVGKTTTLAKLAARLRLRQDAKVGLVTVDTYRVAAVEQLRTYAEILSVPVRVALSPGELHRAIREMRALDAVLIDTPGRSQKDAYRLGRLRGMVEAAEPDETHLVVPGTAGAGCMRAILDGFLPLGADRMIVSKVDEAVSFAAVVNIAWAGRLPLSFVTTGQEVPEDIIRADASAIAGALISPGEEQGVR